MHRPSSRIGRPSGDRPLSADARELLALVVDQLAGPLDLDALGRVAELRGVLGYLAEDPRRGNILHARTALAACRGEAGRCAAVAR